MNTAAYRYNNNGLLTFAARMLDCTQKICELTMNIVKLCLLFSAYGSKQVKTGQQGRKSGSAAAQQSTATQLRRAAYAYKGTETGTNMPAYANM